MGQVQCAANGRFFVRNGVPTRFDFDSAWDLIANLPAADYATYFGTRKAQRFKGALMELMTHSYVYNGSPYGNAPETPTGLLPFTTGTDVLPYTKVGARLGQHANFATPDDDYWAYVEDAVDTMESNGLVMLAYPMPLGFEGSALQGWYTDLIDGANTQSVCYNFGLYLAQGNGPFGGLASKDNIVFQIGSDYGDEAPSPPSAEAEARLIQILLGLKDGGCTQLRGGDWQSPSLATDQAALANYMQQNGIYTYGGTYFTTTSSESQLRTYTQSRASWLYTPVDVKQSQSGLVIPDALPGYEKETAYIDSLFVPGTRAAVRKAQWWSFLSGGTAGVIFGDENIWRFGAGSLAALTGGGSMDMSRFCILMDNLSSWPKLVPSELSSMIQLITSANGTQAGLPTNYVAAAQAYDGTLFLAYAPPDGSTDPQSFTASFAAMGGPLQAYWWDPTDGSFTFAGGFAATSGHSFTTPGANSAGDNDWVLVGYRSGVRSGGFHFGGF